MIKSVMLPFIRHKLIVFLYLCGVYISIMLAWHPVSHIGPKYFGRRRTHFPVSVASCWLRRASIWQKVWKCRQRKYWRIFAPIPRRKQQVKPLRTLLYIRFHENIIFFYCTSNEIHTTEENVNLKAGVNLNATWGRKQMILRLLHFYWLTT